MDPVENFIRRATTAVATFVERLHKITSANKSLVCIGLDPDQDLLPIRDVYDFSAPSLARPHGTPSDCVPLPGPVIAHCSTFLREGPERPF